MPYKLSKITYLIVLAVLVLSACNGQSSAEPTADPDTIYTQAAMTVEAQLTQAAEANPTATNTLSPPTEAVSPTSAPQSATETQQKQGETPGQPLSTSTSIVLSTFTATPPPPSAKAKYELVSQNPADGAVLPPDYKFDMIWTIKNTGDETWTEMYTIEFFIGDRIGSGHYTITRYNFRKSVKPGDTIEVFVDMKTSSKNGDYFSWWKLKDENGNNFGDVSISFVVSGGSTTP